MIMEPSAERVAVIRGELQRHAGKSSIGLSLREFLTGPVDEALQLLEGMLSSQRPAVTAHYEAGAGIRPPTRTGTFCAVAREVVHGGGMELWHCGHDHAPGVRIAYQASPEQHAEAVQCARAWLQHQISTGTLADLPVQEGTR